MKNMRHGKLVFVVLLTVIATSCTTTITRKNKKVYFDAKSRGAYWVETLTSREGQLSRAEWEAKRPSLACMEPSAFNDTETTVDQFCEAYGVCEYKDVQEIKASIQRMKRANKRAAAARAQ